MGSPCGVTVLSNAQVVSMADDPSCTPIQIACWGAEAAKDIAGAAAGGAIDQVATATVQMVGKFVAAFETPWV